MAVNLNPVNLAQVFLTNHANRRALIADTNCSWVRTPVGRWHVRTIEHAFHQAWMALTTQTGVAIPWWVTIRAWLFGYLVSTNFIEIRSLFAHSDKLIIHAVCIIAQRLEDVVDGASRGARNVVVQLAVVNLGDEVSLTQGDPILLSSGPPCRTAPWWI
jgi:hypothetical protein